MAEARPGRSRHRLLLVDVFAERRYAGNPLAVVTAAADLGRDEMQAIAREMNFSETSFVLHDAPRDGAFDVRIFTPREEVPFAGHPTLGTAFVIREEMARATRDRLTLRLGVGEIPVTFERTSDGDEVLWLEPRPPTFGATASRETLARVLGLSPSDIDAHHPVQHVSTGLPFWIVPLTGLDAARRCRVSRDAYDAFVRNAEAKAIFVFARETVDPANAIHARMFSDWYGVPEDPATGSAAACLAAYLVAHRVLGGSEVAVRVEQGMEMGRPSILELRARASGGRYDLRVGGRVVPVAAGVLHE
jgi:trans-2,3-dihydro-3-hydroxyanthranilate isomerase